MNMIQYLINNIYKWQVLYWYGKNTSVRSNYRQWSTTCQNIKQLRLEGKYKVVVTPFIRHLLCLIHTRSSKTQFFFNSSNWLTIDLFSANDSNRSTPQTVKMSFPPWSGAVQLYVCPFTVHNISIPSFTWQPVIRLLGNVITWN